MARYGTARIDVRPIFAARQLIRGKVIMSPIIFVAGWSIAFRVAVWILGGTGVVALIVLAIAITYLATH